MKSVSRKGYCYKLLRAFVCSLQSEQTDKALAYRTVNPSVPNLELPDDERLISLKLHINMCFGCRIRDIMKQMDG